MKKTLLIEGMSCMHCVKHVKEALVGFDPNVEVDLKAGTAALDTDADREALAAAIDDAGYELKEIR